MSSLSKEEKEKKALALRAEALRHLSSAGQMVAKVGTQTVQKTETGKRGDNTLELLLRESAAKAELRQIRLKAMSATESIAKATSVEQQEQPQPGTTESTPLAATPTEHLQRHSPCLLDGRRSRTQLRVVATTGTF
jgi:hypothetical protein